MKTKTIYTYKENNNPYANGEEINVSELETNDNNHYINIFVSNEDCSGAGIYLTKNEVINLVDKLNMSISKLK